MRKRKERGVAVVFAALLLLVLIPMVGLGVDGGVAFMLRARLSAAVDAAVLAGARSLNAGADVQSQAANATAVAQRYFNANLPPGTWGSQNPTYNVSVKQDSQYVRSVSMTASIDAPLYFMGVLGHRTAHIAITGKAQRRNVNVMLVLDRSYSMGAYIDSGGNSGWCGKCGSIPNMIAAASEFVNQFAQGSDNVGMVAFGGNYYLAPPSTNFSSLAGQIANISSSGNTGSAQALWVAYNALATLPDANGQPNGQPGALNVILFFTDGLPNGITANFAPYRFSPDNCAKGSNSMVGWIAQTHGFVDPGPTNGLFNIIATSVSDPNDGSMSELIPDRSGCNFGANSSLIYKDFSQIPPVDYYGNLTNEGMYNQPPYKTVNLAAISQPSQVGAASANAADYVAQRWRAGAINNIVPLVYTISLLDNPAEVPDPVFLNRVANSINSPIYDSTKPTGLYINTNSADQLPAAFQQIASKVLQLSQ
ncbi:MAG: VWA domain-containing protein [Acidobacteriia bacterium]|nr:VWA domain-containing protein [Terriglobia bacterium]